jgi:hypothetical protein
VRPDRPGGGLAGRVARGTRRIPSGVPGQGKDEETLGEVRVPIGGSLFSLDEAYTAKLTVPAGTLSEENPGDPAQSGTYKIVVTAFLDSAIGGVGYDMMGYAEGPIIKVESPQ